MLDLVITVNWKGVKRALKYFFPTDKNDYEILFHQLKRMKLVRPSHKGEEIEIRTGKNTEENLKDKSLKELYEDWKWHSIATNRYSMSFRKWQELISLPISQETLDHYLYDEIVAMFLWEITFYGSEKQSLKQGKEMMKRVKQIKSNPKKYTKPYEALQNRSNKK